MASASSQDAPQPHWKTITTTPKAAMMGSRFVRIALMGRTAERSSRASSKPMARKFKPTMKGIASLNAWKTSTNLACCPPTVRVAPRALACSGRMVRRRSSTSARASSESGEVDGARRSTVALAPSSPLIKGAATFPRTKGFM
ncbi:hypothetical protein D3C72_1944570 [compost metagenome]